MRVSRRVFQILLPETPTPEKVALRRSVICFAGNYTPYAASWVRYVALPPRDQMHMGMIDCLTSDLSAIHADIEASYCSISFQNIGPKLIEHDAEGAAFWLR